MRIELRDSFVEDQTRWWDDSTGVESQTDDPVFEERWYSLAIYDYDKSLSYCIKIGDEELKVASRAFYNSLEFEKGVYFESASGTTNLGVYSRDGEGREALMFRVSVYVVPSKIGWANYKALVNDLRMVCHSLITDVKGKSQRGGRNGGKNTSLWKTHEEELLSVCSVCRKLRPLIFEIKRSPKSAMRVSYSYESVGRCKSFRGQEALMRRGANPKDGQASRKCLVGHLSETMDIAEHRLLKAFIKLLLERLGNCLKGMRQEARRLEAEQKYRSRTNMDGEQSLYELEDAPRIRRFRERAADARNIADWLQGEIEDSFWGEFREEMFAPESMQFIENEYYLNAANIILRYLRDTSHWGGTFGTGLMAKKTSRMYEQWVLIQLVSAFSSCGLKMTGWDDVIGRSIDKQFGFDFEHNTTFSATFKDGYEIRVRYEPWIVPKAELYKRPGETLYYTGKGASWCPDIMIELTTTGNVRETVYAIAMDAKYSKRPTKEMRENVLKYAKIRNTHGLHGRRVARQVWLVYPGGEGRKRSFFLDDEAMSFSATAGVVYRDSEVRVEPGEQIFGDIILMPSDKAESFASSSEVGIVPKKPFVDFASGTLSYFGALID